MKIQKTKRYLKVLDFDIETVAAGFADPQWVPQKVTVIAWSWIDSEKVEVYTRLEKPSPNMMLSWFLEAYDEADMVTGHNLLRFDLPVLNSEMLRHGYPSLSPKLTQDTMRIVKTKGFKKGQDNIGKLLRLPLDKMPLTWQEWQDAYEEKDWATVKERAASDVLQHKLMRTEMLERGWLLPPRVWKP